MWRAIFDFVKGTSHLDAGLPCQDSCRVITWPQLAGGAPAGKVLIAVCSDGAGSATHSHVGSQVACDALVARALDHLHTHGSILKIDRDEVVRWYAGALSRIQEEAETIGVAPRELACTLLTAIVSPSKAVFAQVGDGAIVFRSGDDFHTAFWPQRGEYANTTNFLTSLELDKLIDFAAIDADLADVAIFSDGLERLILRFTDRTVHSPFLSPLFAQLRATADVETLFAPLREFLDSPAINERTDDDKTLILASRI